MLLKFSFLLRLILVFCSLISYVKASDDTIQNQLTCYTCPEGASSNAKCNSQAIDIPCHLDLQVCKNRLLVDDKGMTLLVTKQCVDKKSCIKGCATFQNNTRACDDCCTSSYCNRELRTPTQIENAAASSSTTIKVVILAIATIRNIA